MKLVPAERSQKTASLRRWTLVAAAALLLAMACALAGCGTGAAETGEDQDGTAATEQTAATDADQKDSQEAAEETQGAKEDAATDTSQEKESEGSADGASSDEAVKMSDIVGLWVLHEIQAKDEAMSLTPDEVDLYSNGGYNIALRLSVDGKAKMTRYGETYEGTWEFTSGTAGVVNLTEVISDTGVIDPATAEKEAQGPATLRTDFKYVDGLIQLTGPNKEIEVLELAD